MEKTYTKSEIYTIIDAMIKEELKRKNAYIEKNGYTHKNTLEGFGQRVTAFSELYGKF